MCDINCVVIPLYCWSQPRKDVIGFAEFNVGGVAVLTQATHGKPGVLHTMIQPPEVKTRIFQV